MLIHITPRFFTCSQSGADCNLVELRVDEWGLRLLGDKDIVTRRPYPNKRYAVGCRKVGQKAISGILVETPSPVSSYCVEMRWAVGAERLVTHRVTYRVLDEDFDAVTDNMSLWYGWNGRGDDWGASRWPDCHKESPASAQPRMQFSSRGDRTGAIEDIVEHGLIAERSEVFDTPTVERYRLLSPANVSFHERLPSSADVFRVG